MFFIFTKFINVNYAKIINILEIFQKNYNNSYIQYSKKYYDIY